MLRLSQLHSAEIRPKSGPVNLFPARKHYCVTERGPEAAIPTGTAEPPVWLKPVAKPTDKGMLLRLHLGLKMRALP